MIGEAVGEKDTSYLIGLAVLYLTAIKMKNLSLDSTESCVQS